jgi:hypothetical protein
VAEAILKKIISFGPIFKKSLQQLQLSFFPSLSSRDITEFELQNRRAMMALHITGKGQTFNTTKKRLV